MLNIIFSHFQFSIRITILISIQFSILISIQISIPFSSHPAFYKVSEAVACQLLPGIG